MDTHFSWTITLPQVFMTIAWLLVLFSLVKFRGVKGPANGHLRWKIEMKDSVPYLLIAVAFMFLRDRDILSSPDCFFAIALSFLVVSIIKDVVSNTPWSDRTFTKILIFLLVGFFMVQLIVRL
ncbi:hypothetical protein [Deinococcus cellulosilyticus]|uniref:Uncharacterized protein n=1 Tax=Deinococcus cellulosilyticus (strain DSM 18568 / NBRC 106333 / KACC 11606 / 5516J-15) TaxID=1223518 RepID=A0A511NAN4_DEIC1|nr:hypothetical protein [Deinococcus cellulosilyticus]GEM49558.1 hypothetical protein DC3_51930 [Deinococcus cellulosilyticus NBRC 106333 = KACC 11606]